MSFQKNLLVSSSVGFCFLVIDRITKLYALHAFIEPYELTNFIGFELVFNRGISWGMLRFDNDHLFLIISCVIASVIFLLLVHTKIRLLQGHTIICESLVLAGALSNLADRFIYGGVIDFIVLSYHSWVFPVFNVADIGIVVGILGMFLHSLQESS